MRLTENLNEGRGMGTTMDLQAVDPLEGPLARSVLQPTVHEFLHYLADAQAPFPGQLPCICVLPSLTPRWQARGLPSPTVRKPTA